MRELEAPKLREESDIEHGLLLLAAELARAGKACHPETPAFIRRQLGLPLVTSEPSNTETVPRKPRQHAQEGILRMKGAPDGTRRYELVFPPKNGALLVSWGRFWRKASEIRAAFVTIWCAETPAPVALPPIAARPQLPAHQ